MKAAGSNVKDAATAPTRCVIVNRDFDPMNATVFNDSLCTATWASRPGDFVSLMTLYESNYVRLRGLVEDLFALPDSQVSRCPDDCPLHLRVVERSPYTVTLSMTYEFVEAGNPIADPDLQL